jgi:O-antigen ligase
MISLAYAALWLFVFAVPWQNVVVIPGFGTISKLLGMIAIGLALLATLFSGRIRRWDAFHALALAFVIYAGWGTYRGIYEEHSFSKIMTYIQLFLVLLMIWELAPTPRRLLGLLFAYVCGAYVGWAGTVAAYRSAVGARRFAAQGFDPNDLGMTLALAIPMAWYLGMTYRNPVLKWVARAYIPLGLWAIGLTASRGAMIATLVALTIVPLMMTKLSPGRVVAGILLLAVSGVIVVANIPQESWDRLGTTVSEVEGGTMNSRLTVWKGGVRAYTEKPFFGHGTATFSSALQKAAGFRMGAHNTFLLVLVEQGLVGFLIFALMIGLVFRRARMLPTLERRYALVQLTTLMVAILPLGWDEAKPFWVILAIITGMAAAVASAQSIPAAIAHPAPRWQAVPSRRPVPS